MCGILLFHSRKINKSLEETFKKSLRFMKNRGPDESLILKNKNYLIGFNRLSINNISNGSQPFESKCGRYVSVFNGEIFNYKNLEDKLNKRGIKTKNASEIEIILNYYKIYGENCIKYFKGFFAIVIFDKYKKKIFSAVDRLGIKQIYYYYSKTDDLLILTSDYSHLIKYKIFDLKFHRDSIENYLCFGRTFGKNTIFQNIYDLQPGTKLNFDQKSGLSIRKYWNTFGSQDSKKILKKNKFEKFKEIFLSSNKLWKKSEIVISNTISTGVDSNLINYGFEQNKIQHKKFSIIEGRQKKEKFSIIEGRQKKEKNHYELLEKINVNLILKEFNKFIIKNKNPFALANSGSTALFQLYKNIKKKKIRVAFTGEGGDEIFGGYTRYKRQLKLLKHKKMNFENHLIQTYKKEIKLFSKFCNFAEPSNIKTRLKMLIKRLSLKSRNPQNKILEFDQVTWLPMLLRKHDVIGMNYNIEVRPQLVDYDLVKYVNNLISGDLKFNEKKNKIFIKEFLKKYANLDFTKKKGTPAIMDKIYNDEQYLNKVKATLRKSFFIKNYFKKDILQNNEIFKKKNSVFLWRLYVISAMFPGRKI